MKKFLLHFTILLLMVFTTACDKNSDHNEIPNHLGGSVIVTVTDPNGPVQGKRVYLFVNTAVTSSTPVSESSTALLTDASGSVRFDLRFSQYYIEEAETPIYFAVFYDIMGQRFVSGSAALTLSRGDVQRITLRVPQ